MSGLVLQGPKFQSTVDDTTLGNFFFNYASHYKDNICQVDGTFDKTETFGSVKLRSTRVAIALQKRGIQPGNVIAICSLNSLDNPIPMLASYYIGAIVSNLEPSLSVRHCKYLLSLITPRVIFVEKSATSLIEESLRDFDFETEIFVFGNSSKYSSFDTLQEPQENENNFQPTANDKDAIALIYFSSGTTGLPKPIAYSSRSFLYIVLQMLYCGANGNILHFTSFYWITATIILTVSFRIGRYRVFVRNIEAENIFRVIEKYKVFFIFSSSYLTYELTSFINYKKYDTSSLKYLLCTGSAIAPAQINKLNKLFPTAFISLLYGMSELGLIACFDSDLDKELAKRKLTSCGKAVPGVQLKIVDIKTGKTLGVNEKGEIRLKSIAAMKEYYKMDSDYSFDENGFFKTGDVGYYDDDGCLYVVQRIKEMFKYKGWHILPSLIEAVLLEHPSIKEAVVFGLPCGENGEAPAACIVLHDGFALNENEINLFLKDRVAEKERLTGGITFLNSIPRTPTGKVIRSEVKELVIKLNI